MLGFFRLLHFLDSSLSCGKAGVYTYSNFLFLVSRRAAVSEIAHRAANTIVLSPVAGDVSIGACSVCTGVCTLVTASVSLSEGVGAVVSAGVCAVVVSAGLVSSVLGGSSTSIGSVRTSPHLEHFCSLSPISV